MTINEAHAWWSRLRHQGLLLSPVVMLESYPDAPQQAPLRQTENLRKAFTRFNSAPESADPEQITVPWVDALLEDYLGHQKVRLAKKPIPEKLTTTVRIGNRSETLRPHRVVFADDGGTTPALLVVADASPQVRAGPGTHRLRTLSGVAARHGAPAGPVD